MDRRFRLPRVWSNQTMRKISPLVHGDVVNVSAWRDEDKEGGTYRQYFTNARAYSTTNFGGYRGADESTGFLLDLERDLPAELHESFDFVFNHTTLEHVFDVFTAFANLCAMSRDAVLVVVPAVQEEHTSDSFSDYWRFTSRSLEALFAKNGFQIVVLTSSPYCNAGIYHLALGSKEPERWKAQLPRDFDPANEGRRLVKTPIRNLLRRIVPR
tara:strand:+ start:18279 stop:18917 length:639 start_codon:yes stop_codon:yes gene_type:complete